MTFHLRAAALAAAAATLAMSASAQARSVYFCTIKNNTGAGTDREVSYILDTAPQYNPQGYDQFHQRAADKSNENAAVPYNAGHMHCAYTSMGYPGSNKHYVVVRNTDPAASGFNIFRFGSGDNRAAAVDRASRSLNPSGSATFEVVADGDYFNGPE